MLHSEFIHNGKDRKITVENAKLNKSMEGYSLDITYIIETPSEIQELHIPRLMLPLGLENISLTIDHDYYSGSLCTAKTSLGNRRVLAQDGRYFTIKTIETKTKEMTLEEIEKKLGHKVKIVNK